MASKGGGDCHPGPGTFAAPAARAAAAAAAAVAAGARRWHVRGSCRDSLGAGLLRIVASACTYG